MDTFYSRGWKGHGATSGMKFHFRSGDKKNDHRSRVCSRFLIAARKNHPNTSVYVHHIIYYNMVLRHCYYYCTAVNIMRNERWSSDGHPSKIIGFLRAGARAAVRPQSSATGAVFDIIILYYLNIILSNRILFNIIYNNNNITLCRFDRYGACELNDVHILKIIIIILCVYVYSTMHFQWYQEG